MRLPTVEIRVHGVNGGDPEHMLDDPFPIAVAGDDSARFLRSRSWRTGGPHVLEAFHWGRFTSGSPTRALWLLLVPFAVLNLAGFTTLPTRDAKDRAGRVVRLLIRLLGLVLTVTLVLAVARASLDLVAHQCASAPRCVADNPWLRRFVGWGEGGRFALALLPPGLVLLTLWSLGRQTYLYDPPGDPQRTESTDAFTGTLGDRAFWHAGRVATALRSGHVIAACAVLGALCLLAVDTERTRVPAAVTEPVRLLLGSLFTAAAVLALVVVITPGWFAVAHGERRWLEHARRAALALVMFAGAAATVAIARTPPAAGPLVAPLPGFETATIIVLCALTGLLVLLLLACSWMKAKQDVDGKRLASFTPLWWGFAPWMLAALAITLAGGMSGGLLFWVGDLLGVIASERSTAPPETEQWPILLGPSSFVIGNVSWWLVVVFLALVPWLVAALLRTGQAPGWLLGAGAAAVVAMTPLAPGWRWTFAGLVVALGVGAAVMWRLAWRREKLPDLVGRDYQPRASTPPRAPLIPQDGSSVRRVVALQWRLARSKFRYHWPLGLVALVGAGGIAVSAVLVVLPARSADDVPVVGPLLLSAVAGGFVLLGLRSWNNPGLRTTVGILWDLVAFLPRAGHPLCPPPYGGRAVLELARRVVDIADDSTGGLGVARKCGEPSTDPIGGDRPARRAGHVVLSGHSQGSLVCLAAVAVIAAEAERGCPHQEPNTPCRPGPSAAGTEYIAADKACQALPKVSLVTYGSQLQWAYARLFPRYVNHTDLHTTYHHRLGGRWRNLYRWTDPLGGPVLAWPTSGVPAPIGPTEPASRWDSVADPPPAPDQEVRAAMARFDGCGPDVRLPDPVRITDDPLAVRPPLLGHGDYFGDQHAYACAVAAVTSTVEPACCSGAEAGRPPRP